MAFVEYDLALSAEGRVVTVDEGWPFVGTRRPPLVTVVEKGWIPRPGELRPLRGSIGGSGSNRHASAPRKGRVC